MRQKILFLSFLLVVSCSGYRYTQTANPFEQYGIDSLSIPMFYNFSNQPELASSFTRETYKLMSGFSGLKLKSGFSNSTDAVLIGIIRSAEKVADTLRSETPRVASAVAPQAVGSNRPEFYVPGITRVALMLQVVVIKRPTTEEIELLQSELGTRIPAQGKILFNETFNLSEAYNREYLDGEAVGVVGTQNAGALRRTKETLALKAAEQIRDMIIYAF